MDRAGSAWPCRRGVGWPERRRRPHAGRVGVYGGGFAIDAYALEHPLELHADAGFEALPIDLNRNGWTDLFVACHRNDVGHVVDSQIFWNGPEGLSNDRTTPLPGMGPHRLNARLPGNAYTRAPIERYTSPPHETGSRRPSRIGWEAEVPDTTALQFEVRCAEREEGLEGAAWMGPRW